LRDASAKVLSNVEDFWPRREIRLQGFVFNELGRKETVDSRTQIKWLRLQSPFVSQPYEQMATVFRNMGYAQEAVDVEIAGKWDEGVETIRKDCDILVHSAKHLQVGHLIVSALRIVFYDALWFFGFGWLVGYGYLPWNAFFVSIGFVVIGTFIFHFSERMEVLTNSNGNRTNKRRNRWVSADLNFSAFIYSLETFLPLVKLGVADQWKIDANAGRLIKIGTLSVRKPGVLVLWYYRLHVMAGWVFTSLWVAAFTGILKH
jgi:hypothetical protein